MRETIAKLVSIDWTPHHCPEGTDVVAEFGKVKGRDTWIIAPASYNVRTPNAKGYRLVRLVYTGDGVKQHQEPVTGGVKKLKAYAHDHEVGCEMVKLTNNPGAVLFA